MPRPRHRHRPRPPGAPVAPGAPAHRRPRPPRPPRAGGAAGAPARPPQTDANGIVGLEHGVDRKDHPAGGAASLPDFMSWLVRRSDLRIVCCYLTDETIAGAFSAAFPNLQRPEWPATENFDHGRHWVINVPLLRSSGWFVLPLFFGFDWPKFTSLTPTARAGTINARMAKFLAFHHGFPPGSVLYIDDEASARNLNPGELAYYDAYFAELARLGPIQFPDPTTPPATTVAYRPGYYGHNKTASQLLVATPDLCVWSDDFKTHGRYAVAGSGDQQADRLPLGALDRAAIAAADVERTPMKTAYPTDIDARVHPIVGVARSHPPQVAGRLWPVLLQRWWTARPTLPGTAPVGDAAWPRGARPVASWDFNESLSRDPSNPTARVRLGVSTFGREAHFGEVFAADPVYRGGQPVEGIRGSVLVNRYPLSGAVGQCVEVGDGRPQRGVVWSGPYVHPFSPVAGADGVPALVFVTTTGRLALYYTPTRTLRLLSSADRSNGAAASADPWAVRLPHAIALVPGNSTSAVVVWVGADQRLWRADVPLAAGDMSSPSPVRADLVVHPAARVASARVGQGTVVVSVRPDASLVRTDVNGAAPVVLGTVLPSGPLAAAGSITGDGVVVAQLPDYRLAAATATGARFGALTTLQGPPGDALVQPLAGAAAVLDPVGSRVAAPASDLKLYEWSLPRTGSPGGPAALAPPGMPTVHPFSDVVAVAAGPAVTYGCARCDGDGGPIAVSAARLEAL